MLAARCEARAIECFLRTIRTDGLARKLHWRVAITSSKACTGFSRYASELRICGSDGAVTKEASIPLFEDGIYLHSEHSLEQALLVAVSESAIAVQGPTKPMRTQRRRAADQLSA